MLMQGINYLIPFLVIPLIINRLSLETYGIVALAQGIMVLFTSLADFGFNLTGTRLISQRARNNADLISQIFSIKVLLLSAGFLLLIMMASLIKKWNSHFDIILLSYAITVGQGLFPVWYFQGTQKMDSMLVLSAGSRIAYLAGIIIWIREPSEALYVNLLNGGSWIIVSLIAWTWIVKKEGKIKFSVTRGTFEMIKNNWKIFASNLAGDAYRASGLILAGFFLPAIGLGLYGLFDKVIMLIQNVFIAAYRGLFPAIAAMAKSNDRMGIANTYRSYYKRFGSLMFPGILLLLFFGDEVLYWLSEDITENVRHHLLIISLIPLFFFLSVPLTVNLVAFDRKKAYLIYNMTTALVFIGLGSFAAALLGMEGLLLSHSVALFCTVATGYHFNKKDRLPLGRPGR